VAIHPGSWLASSSDLACVQQVRHFIERHRFADEVALDLIAVQEPETFGLLLFLDALGDHLDAKAVARVTPGNTQGQALEDYWLRAR
jgi:hypothetical protein